MLSLEPAALRPTSHPPLVLDPAEWAAPPPSLPLDPDLNEFPELSGLGLGPHGERLGEDGEHFVVLWLTWDLQKQNHF